jgi:hypothetical protein
VSGVSWKFPLSALAETFIRHCPGWQLVAEFRF